MKKVLCLCLAALLLSGCMAYSYTPTQIIFEPGTYVVTVPGHNGDIKIATTFNKNRVTKIEVLEHQESLGVGDTAMQKTADAIISKQGFDVDIISEATYSSVAMLEAVSKAAKAAGANVEIITMDTIPKPEPEEAIPFPEPPYNAGTYTASAEGFHGDVTVTVELSEDAIISIKAIGPDETPEIGTMALEQMPDRIVEAGTADVDVVSGATFTSDGIKAAVIDAVNQAK